DVPAGFENRRREKPTIHADWRAAQCTGGRVVRLLDDAAQRSVRRDVQQGVLCDSLGWNLTIAYERLASERRQGRCVLTPQLVERGSGIIVVAVQHDELAAGGEFARAEYGVGRYTRLGLNGRD